MACVPLFVATEAALKARLRLSGVSGDGQAVLDDVVREVRVGFYDRLGLDRIDAILVTGTTSSPTTAAELERVKAENIEAKWVKAQMLREMPVLFMDAAAPQQNWNDEGLTRQASRDQTTKEYERLMLDVEDGLRDLAEEEAQDGIVRTSVFGYERPDDEEVIRPGGFLNVDLSGI
jgi:hypothetical protein